MVIAAAADIEHAADVEWGRRSLMGFVEVTHPGYDAGWVHYRMCDALERFTAAVDRKERPRLIITTMPRAGKTAIVAERWPVWMMGTRPMFKVACASYGQELANDSSYKARAIARSEMAADVFGWEVAPESKPKHGGAKQKTADLDRAKKWDAPNGARYRAVGIRTAFTGDGCDVLVVDDFVRDWLDAASASQREARWAWFLAVARTRLEPGAGILLMATRWNTDDMIGRNLQAQTTGGDQWEVLHFEAIATADDPVSPEDMELAARFMEDTGKSLPTNASGELCWRLEGEALQEERYSLEELEAQKAALLQLHGTRYWSALYQGDPVSEAGAFLKRSWYRERWTCEMSDIASTADEVSITIDSNKKDTADSDYSSLQLWARKGSKKYLLDRVLLSMNYPEFESTTDGFIARHAHWVISTAGVALLEDTANATTYMQVRGASYRGVALVPFSPQGDTPGKDKSKKARGRYLQRASESGAVIIPDSGRHPWAEAVLDCWCGFGVVAHDDDFDSAAQLMMRWTLAEQVQESAVDYDFGW